MGGFRPVARVLSAALGALEEFKAKPILILVEHKSPAGHMSVSKKLWVLK